MYGNLDVIASNIHVLTALKPAKLPHDSSDEFKKLVNFRKYFAYMKHYRRFLKCNSALQIATIPENS